MHRRQNGGVRWSSDRPRPQRPASLGLFCGAVLLLLIRVLPAHGADTVAVVDARELSEAYYNIMNGPGLDPKTPVGHEPEVVLKAERELQRLKAEYASARATGLSPEARAAYEKKLVEKNGALQALYGKSWRDTVELVKWRSRDLLVIRLLGRIEQYAQEQGIALILNQENGNEMFRREGWSGASLNPFDITQPLIQWLRQKEESERPPGPARR